MRVNINTENITMLERTTTRTLFFLISIFDGPLVQLPYPAEGVGVFPAAVVRVCPVKMIERAVPVKQRYLRVYAFAEIYPVKIIFCREENYLRKVQITGVYIDDPLARSAEGLFDRVRDELYTRHAVRPDQPLEAQEPSLQAGPELLFVVSRRGEFGRLALEVRWSKPSRECRFGLFQVASIAEYEACYELDLLR